MSLLQSLGASPKRAAGGKKRELTPAQLASKRLREHAELKLLGSAVTDGTVDEKGQNLRASLTTRIEQHKEDSKKYPMGGNYYSALIGKYTQLHRDRQPAGGADGSGGAGAGAADAIRPILMKAVLGWRAGNKDLILSFLSTNPMNLTPKEANGILACFKQVKPSKANPKFLETAMNFISFFDRTQWRSSHADKIREVAANIDTALLQAWHGAKTVDSNKDAWVASHRGQLNLIVGEGILEKLEAEGADWGAVEAELASLTKLKIGQSLFGKVYQTVKAKALTALVDGAVNTFMAKQDKITLASVNELIATTTKDAENLPGIDSLPDKRTIQVAYRGIFREQKVKSLGSDTPIKAWSAIKTMLVEQKRVPSILCEDDLVPAKIQYPACAGRAVAEDILGPLTKVRNKCNELLDCLEMCDATNVKAEMEKNSWNCGQLDSSFRQVELAFWVHMADVEGGKMLESKFFGLLASKEKKTSLSLAIGAGRELASSKLFSFAPTTVQENVKSAMHSLKFVEMCEDLQIGQKATSFLLRFKAQLIWFAEIGDRRGGDAIKHLLSLLDKVKGDPKKVKTSWLDILFQFEFCVDKAEQTLLKDVASKVAAINQNWTAGGSNAASSSKV